MKRWHKWSLGVGGGISAFLVLAVLRLIVGNGLIWHFIPWHVHL